MSLDEHLDKMAHYASAEAWEEHQDEDSMAYSSAPLDNFFNDNILTLIYHSAQGLNSGLEGIKKHLDAVSTCHLPGSTSARAAVALGRLVRAYSGNTREFRQSSPQQWFDLALELDSVVGAYELADTLLDSRGLRVELDEDRDLMPRLKRLRPYPGRNTPTVPDDVAQTWVQGARVVVRHLPQSFNGWEREDFSCAVACIMRYLTLLPPYRFTGSQDEVAQRQAALRWLKPAWDALINDYPGEDVDRRTLVEQQL